MVRKPMLSNVVGTKLTREFGFQVSTTAITHLINASRMRGFPRGTFRRINDSERTVVSNEARFFESSRRHRSMRLHSKCSENSWRKYNFTASATTRTNDILRKE